MPSRLVWLFQEHRDLYLENTKLKEVLHDTIQDTGRTIAAQIQIIGDLELQLSRKPALDIPSLVEELFQDIPYEDGRVPDSAWLTPGDPDRDVK